MIGIIKWAVGIALSLLAFLAIALWINYAAHQ